VTGNKPRLKLSGFQDGRNPKKRGGGLLEESRVRTKVGESEACAHIASLKLKSCSGGGKGEKSQ